MALGKTEFFQKQAPHPPKGKYLENLNSKTYESSSSQIMSGKSLEAQKNSFPMPSLDKWTLFPRLSSWMDGFCPRSSIKNRPLEQKTLLPSPFRRKQGLLPRQSNSLWSSIQNLFLRPSSAVLPGGWRLKEFVDKWSGITQNLFILDMVQGIYCNHS